MAEAKPVEVKKEQKKFAVAIWKDMGKGVNDFFSSKKFLADRALCKIGVKPAGPHNLQFISSIAEKDGKIVSTLTPKYKHPQVGTLETEIDSNNNVNSKLNVDKLVPLFEFKCSHKSRSQATVGLGYRHDLIAASIEGVWNATPEDVTKAKGYQVVGNLTTGMQGLQIGAQAEYSFPPSGRTFTDYNVGLEYTWRDIISTVRSEKKMNLVFAQVQAKLNPKTIAYTKVQHTIKPASDAKGPQTEVSFGSLYKVDGDNHLVKAKISNAGYLGAQWEFLFTPATRLKLGGDLQFNQIKEGNHKVFAGIEVGDVD